MLSQLFMESFKIILIKVGTSVLLTNRHKLDEFRIAHIAKQVASLRKKGVAALLVVSGAVACGTEISGFSTATEEDRQASAGIGQPHLMAVFAEIFAKQKLNIAQVLLTEDIFESDARQANLASLLRLYLDRGVIPLINENDVVDLNSFGGNDFLTAQVAKLMKADQVLILSTMAGSKHGVGGGKAKLEAVATLKNGGCHALILDGKAENVILSNVE